MGQKSKTENKTEIIKIKLK